MKIFALGLLVGLFLVSPAMGQEKEKLYLMGEGECSVNSKGEPMFKEENDPKEVERPCVFASNKKGELFIDIYNKDGHHQSRWKMDGAKKLRQKVWQKGQVGT